MSAQPVAVVMAGGTGGHVFPALAVAALLRERGFAIHWLGTDRGIEARLVPEHGHQLHCLNMSGVRGRGIGARILALFQAGLSLLSCLRLFIGLRPQVVLGMGGYAAFPGGIAAWLLRKPLVLHEQNAVAGTTNRLLARFASRVMTAYPIALGGGKNRCVGNPVRADIVAIAAPEQRWALREDSEPLRLLVLGGSLGAKPINDLLPEAVAQLSPEQRPQIRHQAGRDHADIVAADYQARNVDAEVSAFVDDMAEAYAWADMVVCRSGALTVAELAAAGLGAWFVPLPHAIDDHQTANARWLSDAGIGELLPQAELSAGLLAEKLIALSRPQTLAWAEAARAMAKTDAAEQVATVCQELAHAG